ncbi:MBL fold metallo-hydrolase [Aestuariivirga sp.]|uniref:MBL fold metallo-hydrolase n=1 Tax=Aestuariivirga sp. TaxID=2650926 RepID=UPI0039E3EB58
MKWQLNGSRARWPDHVPLKPYPPPPQRVEGNKLAATWLGQSTVLIQTAGLNILTDPLLSLRASPVSWAGPKRVTPPALTANTLPPIDLILLSHSHYDHMDLSALGDLARIHAPRVFTPLGNASYLPKPLPAQEMDWGDGVDFGTVRITCTPARHWSKRGVFDTNKALWGAFVIEAPGAIIYFAGDTGYGDGQTFRDIHTAFGPPRLSLLPVGAYEPQSIMKPQHMNPEEAVAAHAALGSQTSIAIHHSTIQLTDEAIDAPAAWLNEALSSAAIDPLRFLVTDAGQTVFPD